MFVEPVEGVERQVEPRLLARALLQQCHDAPGLRIVVEGFAVPAHERVEQPLARVPERRVPEIVGERHRFGQCFVEPQRQRRRARHLLHFQRVREPGTVVVAERGGIEKHLRFGFQPPERFGVQHPVTVFLVGGARFAGRFGHRAPGLAAAPGEGREQGGLTGFEVGAGEHARKIGRRQCWGLSCLPVHKGGQHRPDRPAALDSPMSATKTIYDGHIVKLELEEGKWEIVRHADAVAILLLSEGVR